MCPAEHDALRAAEDQHWWYAVLRQLVLAEMEARVPAGARVLDAGCGTGGMMARLLPWEMLGVDVSPAAIAHCQERGLRRVTPASVNALPFPDTSMDAVLSLDVLYHEQVDEGCALAEMSRVLKPGGTLILNLPAFDCLRGAHDRAVCGRRRYTACHVREQLGRHNLEVDMIHYWNAWLFLPLLAWRRWSLHARETRSDLRAPAGSLHPLMAKLSLLDARLSRRFGVPFGSSVFAVAHRPPHS